MWRPRRSSSARHQHSRGAAWRRGGGISTIAKFGALLLLVIGSFLAGAGSAANLTSQAAPIDGGLFGLALISVLWAYDGFADVSFAAGEIHDPQRTLPRPSSEARWRSSRSTWP
jgi:amino acid transporter